MEKEYIKDITEIRQMMERSTKFLSLTGLSGVLAGVYALAGVFVGYHLFNQSSDKFLYNTLEIQYVNGNVFQYILIGILVLILALGTAIFLSVKKAQNNNELIWNSTARRFVINMLIPLLTGGSLIIIFLSKGLLGLILPSTLIFYGLALVNASKLTFDEVRYLGIFEIFLGLLSTYFIQYSLFFWIIGFGFTHIIYGIYMHWRYER